MSVNETEELLKQYEQDFKKAVLAPSSLAFGLFERHVIPIDVYNDAIATNTRISAEEKSKNICAAAFKSVAADPPLLVDLVEASEHHSEAMASVCARMKMDPLYEKFSSLAEFFNAPCTESFLAKLAHSIVEWEVIAVHFDLTSPEVETIKEDFRQKYELQKQKMLYVWKKKQGNNATHRKLIQIFGDVGNKAMVDYVRDEVLEEQASKMENRMEVIVTPQNVTEETIDGSGILQPQISSPPSYNNRRHEVPYQTQRYFDVIRLRFGKVLVDVIEEIETINFEKLKNFLLAALEDHRDELEDIESMKEITEFLARNTSFNDYTLLEEIADIFELVDAQKLLTKNTEARNIFYTRILAEDFAAAAVEQYERNSEEMVFVVKWAKKKATLRIFQETLSRAFENAGRYVKLIAVHESLLTFVCLCRSWTVGSLIRVARINIATIKKEGVLKLTIGRVMIFNDITPEVKKEDCVVYQPALKNSSTEDSIANEDLPDYQNLRIQQQRRARVDAIGIDIRQHPIVMKTGSSTTHGQDPAIPHGSLISRPVPGQDPAIPHRSLISRSVPVQDSAIPLGTLTFGFLGGNLIVPLDGVIHWSGQHRYLTSVIVFGSLAILGIIVWKKYF